MVVGRGRIATPNVRRHHRSAAGLARARVLARQQGGGGPAAGRVEEADRSASASIGLGLFGFDYGGQRLFLLHQTTGSARGMLNAVDYHRSMVLLAPGKGRIGLLTSFCDDLVKEADARDPMLVPIYLYKRRWVRRTVAVARPLETVVLPAATKDRVRGTAWMSR